MGIWKPISIVGADAPFKLDEILWTTEFVGGQWKVKVTALFGMLQEGYGLVTGVLTVNLEGIGSFTQCE